MAFFALIQRGDLLIPVIKGGDGPEADCMATWETYEDAEEGAESTLLAQSFPALICDTENLA